MRDNYRDFEAKIYIDQLYSSIERQETQKLIVDSSRFLQQKIYNNKDKIKINL